MSGIGFTGTQRGMTAMQRLAVRRFLIRFESGEFHHGDCVGADAQAHMIARELGYRIISHPPINERKRAFCDSDEVLPPKDYLARNADIVAASDVLIATPCEYDEVLRSGTWSTIRRARRRGVSRILVFPNGRIETETGWWAP